MRALWITLVLLGLPMLMSCGTPPVAPYQMVDPQVTWIGPEGKTAKINIGMFDQLHVGQLLYVVRDHKMVGMLTVENISDYSSDCRVTASKSVTAGADSIPGVGDVRVGDLVMREFKNIADVGLPRERVPRMVPVPYQPTDNSPGAKEPIIPREWVDNWIKTHPKPATTP